MAIEARHYQETRERFAKDPIVQEMAREIPPDEPDLFHDDGTPTWVFIGRANDEYRRRGGQDHGHIGAVAEAICLLREQG